MDTADQPDPTDAPQGATTLGGVLEAAAAQGFEGEFNAVIDDDGRPRLRCPHCDQLVDPSEVTVVWTTRLEGVSDPADMAYVAALRCAGCGSNGVLVAQYGPAAGEADAAILPLLPEPGSPDSAPDRDRPAPHS